MWHRKRTRWKVTWQRQSQTWKGSTTYPPLDCISIHLLLGDQIIKGVKYIDHMTPWQFIDSLTFLFNVLPVTGLGTNLLLVGLCCVVFQISTLLSLSSILVGLFVCTFFYFYLKSLIGSWLVSEQASISWFLFDNHCKKLTLLNALLPTFLPILIFFTILFILHYKMVGKCH